MTFYCEEFGLLHQVLKADGSPEFDEERNLVFMQEGDINY